MTTKLTIQNLKNIKQLEFEIPAVGAYLLTGTNGSGKTSLLTCLSRLRNSNAFQRGFRSSLHPALDSHRGVRDACKKAVYELGRPLEALLGRPNDRIREDLFRYFVMQTQDANKHDLVSFVGKIIH